MNWLEEDQPLKLAKGEMLTLRYRVVVHAGDAKTADIDELYKKYKNEILNSKSETISKF